MNMYPKGRLDLQINSTSKITTVMALLVGMQVSCVKSPEQTSYEDESKQGSIASFGGGASGSKLLKARIGVERQAFGLTATDATAYSVTLVGCLSGYGATVTQANTDVEVYKDDRNCLAKLTGFTTGGVAYAAANPGASDFTTWLANDTARFTNAAGTLTIGVKVASQLASPIGGTEAVVYHFSELLDGDEDYVFSEASVSDAHAITVQSQEAPHFTVRAATFLGADNVTGAPEMTFKMECVDDPIAATPISVAMTDGAGSNTVCGANELSAVTYHLVKDTYSSVIDLDDADAIFGVAGTSITVPTHQYADSGTQEGFNTVTLDGPGALGTAGNENMILILKAGISHTYYNIDITTITQ